MVAGNSSIGVTVSGKSGEYSDHYINAICNNCKKRFNSMCAITMHFKVRAHHTVKIIERGNYDKHTGVRK
jgi:hypothetical protein